MAQLTNNSPFLIVSNNGKSISCKLCSTAVKNIKLWTAHINGKMHREKLLELKQGKCNQALTAHVNGETKKRSALVLSESHDMIEGKRYKKIPVDFFQELNDAGHDNARVLDSAELVPLARQGDSRLQNELFAAKSAVPRDKLDETRDVEIKNDEVVPPTSSSLPEGFFDDKKMDAKARNVDINNVMEEEWHKFQKELVQEQNVADAVVETEAKQFQTSRDIGEAEEEIQDLARFLSLEKEELERKTLPSIKHELADEYMDDETDLDIDDIIHWRVKKI